MQVAFGVRLRNGIGMSVPSYRIFHILKVSIDRFKNPKTNDERNISFSFITNDNISRILDSKSKQLANQLICESMAQITTEYEQKDRKIAEDVPDELLAEDRRRRRNGTSS